MSVRRRRKALMRRYWVREMWVKHQVTRRLGVDATARQIEFLTAWHEMSAALDPS